MNIFIRLSSFVSYDHIINLIVIYTCSVTVFYIYRKRSTDTMMYMGFHADLLLLYLYALL
jgi:hypothetical protein